MVEMRWDYNNGIRIALCTPPKICYLRYKSAVVQWVELLTDPNIGGSQFFLFTFNPKNSAYGHNWSPQLEKKHSK